MNFFIHNQSRIDLTRGCDWIRKGLHTYLWDEESNHWYSSKKRWYGVKIKPRIIFDGMVGHEKDEFSMDLSSRGRRRCDSVWSGLPTYPGKWIKLRVVQITFTCTWFGGADEDPFKGIRHWISCDTLPWEKPIPTVIIHCDCASAIGKVHNRCYNGKWRQIRRKHSIIRRLLTIGAVKVI